MIRSVAQSLRSKNKRIKMVDWNTDELAVDREDAIDIAKEFQYIWIRNVLLETGMDIEDCFPEGDDSNEMSVQQKVKLRKILETNKIEVLDSDSGGINIYFDRELIGIWKKPYYILREDLSQINPKKKLFTIVKIEYWSIFDDDEEEDDI